MSISNDPDPILRVTVGSPIYTRDYQKVGTVKERRGGAVKVGTPLWQRDFWLPATSIQSAIPDGAVMLAIEKAALDEHKLTEPPAAA